jgi:ribonuclease P/MRP protein subunit POP8
LTSALNQFLGIYGTAVPVDILKCEGPNVWIRVPREDSSATTEALSGWIGKTEVAWQIKASGTWLGGLSSGDGRDLFN